MFIDKRHRSASQLGSYTRCGMAYKLERLDRVPSPPAAWTVRGSAVHAAIENWEKEGRPDWFDAIYEEAWEQAFALHVVRYPDLAQWVRTPRVKSTDQDLKLRKAEGWKQFARYAERAVDEANLWLPHVIDSQLAIELPFKINFDSGTAPFFLVGYIDQVKYWRSDGAITVTDIKTGSDDGEDFRQLGLYRYALKRIYNLDVRFGEYWYTKYDRSSGWIDLSRYTEDYIIDQYSELDRAIESGIFLADPGKRKCATCGVKPYCPEMKGR